MLVALLIGGVVFLLAGLAGVALGIPVKEFSFGNTEILAGVMVACTGAIMISLWISISELKKLARRVGSAVVPPMPRPPFSLPSTLTEPSPYEGGLENNGVLAGLEEFEPELSAPSAPSPLPWHEETSLRDRLGETPLPEEDLSATPSAIKPRRNLMFTSTTRRERERAEERAPEPEIADPNPVVAAPPPLPFRPKEASQAENFEDPRPQQERARIVDAASHRAARPPATIAGRHPVVADRAVPPVPEEAPKEASDGGSQQVTILKSGVVDGMAYSLYSDGSIEAQMPEGMMRFASIDELRAHLDQRGG